MSRTRASAKSAGTAFETLIVKGMQPISDMIERRRQTGSKDRGDLSGLRGPLGGRGVVECKDYAGAVKIGPWLDEAEIERRNDDALFAIVVAKRRGYGQPLDQTVIMTLRDFVALCTGTRPE